ncbi:MAG: hypothetical protein ACREXS_13235 [Gammaproteobacteria bacterium]
MIGSRGLWSELNLAAEVVESVDKPQNRCRAVAAREVIGAEVAVLDAVFNM